MRRNRQELQPRTIALIVLGSLLAFLGLAWGAELLLTTPDDTPPIRVVLDDEVVAEFTMDELRQLPEHSFSQWGKSESGPAVLDILAEAGVTDFTTLTVHGTGIRDDGLLVLDREEIDGDVLFDFANRGTVKIAGPDIAWEDRVRDVTELEVD
ncbi:MAG: hypothetical protein ACYC2X_07930 [Coriobacteriia bacterium]